ncbi:MAG: DUF1592 domain-containing protein [Kofleriaceae bacterium]
MRAIAVATMLVGACGGSDTPTSDPGRVTLHRLNNAEYNNTVRDLFGTALTPADDFPADDRGYGFDNVAEALRIGPLHVELYESAADTLIGESLELPVAPSESFEVTGMTSQGAPQDGGWLFFTNGTASITTTAPIASSYRITVNAWGGQAGPDPARLSIKVNNLPSQIIDVTAVSGAPENYSTEVDLPAGEIVVTIGFTNDYYDQATMGDRNLWVDGIVVTGPLVDPSRTPESRRRLFTCETLSDVSCQREILAAFGKRAWRRPVLEDELTRLLATVALASEQGDTAEAGMRLALRQILISPHFVFRVEIDPAPRSLEPRLLNAWELASRLSYFLWSSMPDAELFAVAESGALLDPTELERQVRRMLDDPKAIALTDNFAGQWLFTRVLGDSDPDYALFPEYDDELEAAFRGETRRYFRAFLEEDIPMDQFLTADFTYANDRLAAFYGLAPVNSPTEFVRVSLGNAPRRGFLGQGSFLRVTSNPKRTSPVKRGKWVLDNLLCTPPRPPPPGVEGFPEIDETQPLSVRERFEAHVSNPVCASCHRAMDPIGFALDAYDAVGKHRTMDGAFPIDTTGELANGTTFENPIEMAEQLAANPAVYRCMVEKLYTYTGRSPFRIEATEHIEALTDRFIGERGYLLRELIVDIATHPSFTSRRGEP